MNLIEFIELQLYTATRNALVKQIVHVCSIMQEIMKVKSEIKEMVWSFKERVFQEASW